MKVLSFSEKLIRWFLIIYFITGILRTDCTADLGVFPVFPSISMKIIYFLVPLSYYDFSSSSLHRVLIIYISVVRTKMEYASLFWNALIDTNPNTFDRVQRKFMLYIITDCLKVLIYTIYT
jgi:hypothetical protein